MIKTRVNRAALEDYAQMRTLNTVYYVLAESMTVRLQYLEWITTRLSAELFIVKQQLSDFVRAFFP